MTPGTDQALQCFLYIAFPTLPPFILPPPIQRLPYPDTRSFHSTPLNPIKIKAAYVLMRLAAFRQLENYPNHAGFTVFKVVALHRLDHVCIEQTSGV
jgi:hypothetical protein